MTLRELNRLCGQNNIPDTVKLSSDSGWECGPTDMDIDGVYYHEGKNELVITQGCESDSYRTDYDWIKLEMKVKYDVIPRTINLNAEDMEEEYRKTHDWGAVYGAMNMD